MGMQVWTAEYISRNVDLSTIGNELQKLETESHSALVDFIPAENLKKLLFSNHYSKQNAHSTWSVHFA